MKDYHLGRREEYKASPDIWSFKIVDDIVNGINLKLTNMAGGFPFAFEGRTWPDSERLYLCGEWSNNTNEHRDIQQRLLEYPSGYAAKRFGKSKYKASIRPDFADFSLPWMLFVVWQKCLGNADFRNLLLQVPGNITLVENTTSDKWESAEVWGCRNKELTAHRTALESELKKHHQNLKPKDLARLINVETNKINEIGTWTGQNNIGKILMTCRDCIRENTSPNIDYALLREARIHILGKLYTFEE